MAEYPMSAYSGFAPGLLLIGGAGPTPWSMDIARLALAQADRRSMRMRVADQAATLAATAQLADGLARICVIDLEDPEACAAWAIERRAAGEEFDVVLGLRGPALVAAARTAAALGLPGNPPDAVRRARDQAACRSALTAAGFTRPDAVQRSALEYSVEGVFLGGQPYVLAVTKKERSEPPYAVELEHVLPAPIDEHLREEMGQEVVAALKVLELTYGFFHVDVWDSPDGVVLGEVHPGNADAAIHRMIEHAIPGFELFGAVLDDTVDAIPATPPPTPTRAAATRFLTAPPGQITAITGWDQARAHPAVLHAHLAAQVGDRVRPLRTGDDRLGYLLVGAADAPTARTLARELAASVTVTVIDA